MHAAAPAPRWTKISTQSGAASNVTLPRPRIRVQVLANQRTSLPTEREMFLKTKYSCSNRTCGLFGIHLPISQVVPVSCGGGGTLACGAEAPDSRRCSAPPPGSGGRSGSGRGLAPPTGPVGPPPHGCWSTTPPPPRRSAPGRGGQGFKK